MFSICLLIIGAIALVIATEKQFPNAEQVELVPIRIKSQNQD